MNEIWAHCLVKNEARWLWYSVTSVIDHVDKLLLWDTGSTDNTLSIIEKLNKKYPDKIIFEQRKQKTADEFTKVRQEMLTKTTSDWFLVVDGDEVWWQESIKKLISEIRKNGDNLESIVVPTVNLVGDIFHLQPASAGKYNIAGRVGHFNLRAVNRKIPGLQALGPHGKMGWADEEGKMIQDRSEEKIKFVKAPYLHLTNLRRSAPGKDAQVAKRKKKLRYELGTPVALDYYYPEVFFKSVPGFIESPWQVMSTNFKTRALIETPLRKIKRMVWKGGVGY